MHTYFYTDKCLATSNISPPTLLLLHTTKEAGEVKITFSTNHWYQKTCHMSDTLDRPTDNANLLIFITGRRFFWLLIIKSFCFFYLFPLVQVFSLCNYRYHFDLVIIMCKLFKWLINPLPVCSTFFLLFLFLIYNCWIGFFVQIITLKVLTSPALC